jgi:hypothetical protein
VIVGQPAQHLDLLGRQPDLLLGFAQRSALGRLIPGVAAPAREADLARMVREVRGALGEDDGVAHGMVHHQQ